jgi:tetratricopeptide (TPR) repeat protein
MANPVDTDYSTSGTARLHQRQGPARVCRRYSGLWIVLLLLSVIETGVTHAASCAGSSGAAAVTACQKELESKPGNVDLRIRYADALMNQRQHEEAVSVLRKGLTMYPGSTPLKRKYRLASSLADEQESINNLSIKTPAAGTSSGVNEILCKTLKGERALTACNNVLKTDPENVTALTRRGDELMTLNRVEGAVSSYRHAIDLDPTNAAVKRKLKTAEAKMPAKKRIAVAESPPPAKATPPKKRLEVSKPKIYVPRAKSPPEQRGADISTVAVAKPLEPVKPRPAANGNPKNKTVPVSTVTRTVEPDVAQRYSNAPLSAGVTF